MGLHLGWVETVLFWEGGGVELNLGSKNFTWEGGGGGGGGEFQCSSLPLPVPYTAVCFQSVVKAMIKV